MLQEAKTIVEVPKAETEQKPEGEGDKEGEKEKETPAIKDKSENRDWKRNGTPSILQLLQ